MPDLIEPKKVLQHTPRPHPQFLNNAFCDPYSGCEYGCAYCYGLKEEVFETGEGPSPWRVGVKTTTAFALKKELAALNEKGAKFEGNKISIGLGFASDPYQASEEQYQITQRCLEI